MTRSTFRDAALVRGRRAVQRIALAMLDAGASGRSRGTSAISSTCPSSTPRTPRSSIASTRSSRETLPRVPDFARPLLGDGIEQGRKYRDLIARFGRLPHRNEALGRASTPEEAEFLKTWDERRRPKEFRTPLA